jgi:hypothetical protein
MAHSNSYVYKKRPAPGRTSLSFGEVVLLVIAAIHLLLFFRQDVPKSYTTTEYRSTVNMDVSSKPPRKLEL